MNPRVTLGSQSGEETTHPASSTTISFNLFKHTWFSRQTKCTKRIKFFIWLILVDRLNTKTILIRRHIHVHNDDHCVMCTAGVDETIDHLFFLCPFAWECWNRIVFNWDIGSPLAYRIQLDANHQNMPFFVDRL